MHENTREWHSSQSVAQLRVKRPLSTGERDLNIARISGRNRSKTIHSTHESVVRYRASMTQCLNNSNNSNNNLNNNNNNNSNNSNNSNNDCINSQMSANSNINYFYRNYNERLNQSNIDGLMSTSAIDISPTFEYMDTNDMPIVGEYLNSASQSLCPTLKHNICVKNNNLKSTIATNTITSSNDKDLRKFRASSLANNTYSDGKHETNKDIQQISTVKTDELATSNSRNNNNSCFKSTSILKQLLRSKVTSSAPLNPTESNTNNTCHSIPTKAEKAQFRRSLDSATNLVFHRRNGLPLTSSPAPMRKSGTCFDFDSSLTSVNAIKKALFEKDPDVEVEKQKSISLSTSAPASTTISSLLGNFEESVLNGRLEPASIVHGFTAEIGASGSFCPRHKTFPVTVFFYTLQDTDKADKVSSPYLGHINLGKKGYHIPRKGTVQATLFNPHGTVVKMFVVRYDLSEMPPNSRTFLRQRTLFMPSDANENDADNRKWLRYLIHLRFVSSKSGRIYLHTDVRIIVFRKHDLDVATINGQRPYELRSFTTCPVNPKYS